MPKNSSLDPGCAHFGTEQEPVGCSMGSQRMLVTKLHLDLVLQKFGHPHSLCKSQELFFYSIRQAKPIRSSNTVILYCNISYCKQSIWAMVYPSIAFYKRTFSFWDFFSESHLLLTHKLLSLFTSSTLHQIAISLYPTTICYTLSEEMSKLCLTEGFNTFCPRSAADLQSSRKGL